MEIKSSLLKYKEFAPLKNNLIQVSEVDGKDKFRVKMIDDPKYEWLEWPSKKLRAYMQTDYLPLVNYYSNLKEN